MPHEITRRDFNRTAAALPLVGFPVATSDVTKSKSLRLKVQFHRICVDGHHLEKENWQIEFFVQVVQRKKSAPRYWHARTMTPTDAFAARLKESGFNVVRHNSKCLIADRVSVPNGVAGLCLMLESAFPLDQQDELWTDLTPERWEQYVVPDSRVVKRFWIGEART